MSGPPGATPPPPGGFLPPPGSVPTPGGVAPPSGGYLPPPAQPYVAAASSGTRQNVWAIVSLVLGVVSIAVLVCCWPLGVASGVAALVTGYVGLRRTDEFAGSGRGVAIAGMVTGGIGVALSVLLVVVLGLSMLGGSSSGLS